MALESSGMPYEPGLARFGPWRKEHGRNEVYELLGESSAPDAFFCASDIIAAVALDALHGRGLRVPDDACRPMQNRSPGELQVRKPS